MQRKLIIGGLLVLALLWAGNLYYLQKYSLSRPLFLQHYIYQPTFGGNVRFELYYLVNNQDAEKMVSLLIPGEPYDIHLRSNEFVVQKYTMHSLKKVMVEMDASHPDLKGKKELLLTELIAFHSHGPANSVEKIGLIHIDLRPEQTRSILPVQSGGRFGNGENINWDVFQADAFAAMKEIGAPLPESIQQSGATLKFQVNQQGWMSREEVNSRVLPMKVTEGFLIRLESEIKGKPGVLYQGIAPIVFTAADGSSLAGIVRFNNNPQLVEQDILQLIREAKR